VGLNSRRDLAVPEKKSVGQSGKERNRAGNAGVPEFIKGKRRRKTAADKKWFLLAAGMWTKSKAAGKKGSGRGGTQCFSASKEVPKIRIPFRLASLVD